MTAGQRSTASRIAAPFAALPWLAGLVMLIGTLAFTARAADVDQQPSTAREGFQRGNFPWYDAEHDALRPIKVQPRPPERKPLTLPKWTSNVFWILAGAGIGSSGRGAGADVSRWSSGAAARRRGRGGTGAQCRQHRGAAIHGRAAARRLAGRSAPPLRSKATTARRSSTCSATSWCSSTRSALIDLMRGKTNRQYLREAGAAANRRGAAGTDDDRLRGRLLWPPPAGSRGVRGLLEAAGRVREALDARS